MDKVGNEKNLLDAKAASLIARKYYEDIAGKGSYRLALEEAELSEDKAYWLVTIGIYTPTRLPAMIAQGLNERVDYKIFKINSNTGEVVSMKMRAYPLANVTHQ